MPDMQKHRNSCAVVLRAPERSALVLSLHRLQSCLDYQQERETWNNGQFPLRSSTHAPTIALVSTFVGIAAIIPASSRSRLPRARMVSDTNRQGKRSLMSTTRTRRRVTSLVGAIVMLLPVSLAMAQGHGDRHVNSRNLSGSCKLQLFQRRACTPSADIGNNAQLERSDSIELDKVILDLVSYSRGAEVVLLHVQSPRCRRPRRRMTSEAANSCVRWLLLHGTSGAGA